MGAHFRKESPFHCDADVETLEHPNRQAYYEYMCSDGAAPEDSARQSSVYSGKSPATPTSARINDVEKMVSSPASYQVSPVGPADRYPVDVAKINRDIDKVREDVDKKADGFAKEADDNAKAASDDARAASGEPNIASNSASAPIRPLRPTNRYTSSNGSATGNVNATRMYNAATIPYMMQQQYKR